MMDLLPNNAIWKTEPMDAPHNSRKARLLAVGLFDVNDAPVKALSIGEKLKIKVMFVKYTQKPVHVHVIMKNRFHQIICSMGTYTLNMDVSSVQAGEAAVFELVMDCMMEAGEYPFMVKLAEESDSINRGTEIDSSPWLGPLTILWDYEHDKAPFFGMFGFPCTGSIRSSVQPHRRS